MATNIVPVVQPNHRALTNTWVKCLPRKGIVKRAADLTIWLSY